MRAGHLLVKNLVETGCFWRQLTLGSSQKWHNAGEIFVPHGGGKSGMSAPGHDFALRYESTHQGRTSRNERVKITILHHDYYAEILSYEVSFWYCNAALHHKVHLPYMPFRLWKLYDTHVPAPPKDILPFSVFLFPAPYTCQSISQSSS